MSIACLLRCGRIRFCRGLCVKCYGRMRTAVREGVTTEAGEVAAGRLLPARKRKLPRHIVIDWKGAEK